MPQFKVTIARTKIETTDLSISAKNEDVAEEKAQAIIEGLDKGEHSNLEWELQSEESEVETVEEE